MHAWIEQALRIGTTVVFSLALHWGAVVALPKAWQPTSPQAPDAIEFSLDAAPRVADPSPVAEEASAPPKAKTSRPETATQPRPKSSPRAPTKSASKDPDTSPPEAEEPLDFGDLLLASSGDGPAIPARDGTEANGPARSQSGSQNGTGNGTTVASGSGPSTEAFASLSRRPEPPDISRLLENNFPSKARTQGREGRALIKLKIDASGTATVIKTLSDSDPDLGFGAACSKTLNGTKWSPPIGRKGNPVATYVEYSCNFRIRY